jgi:ABC-type nitrate/sulfonate/bicarbonate transport system ATPase subunit
VPMLEKGAADNGALETRNAPTSLGAVTPASAASVRVEHVSKEFPGDVQALDDINLQAEAGQFVAVVGPSGCGKSTLFNIVAGLIRPDTGRVLLGDRDMTGTTGHCGYMLQRDLLLPWRTVIDNVVIGLDVQGIPRSESYARARELLQRFGLQRFERSYPAALSGGMRQRCAVIRTILYDAPVFLLDEPFTALDAQTRLLMQEWLLEVWSSLGKTVFYITHDIDEAIFLSDRVFAMSARPGHLLSVVDVELDRPRSYEVRLDPHFVGLKAQLVALIRGEAERALAAEFK